MRILYLCSDLGIPVLGRKGASVHVRSLVAALSRAGNSVVLAAPVLNKSPWQEPAPFATPVLHLPPSDEAQAGFLAFKAFNETLEIENSLPAEVRRILWNRELAESLKRRFGSDPPDFLYERASLYGTAGVSLARQMRRPILVELNAPLAAEQSTYRGTCLGDLAVQAECTVLTKADAVLAVSSLLRDHALSLGVEPGRVHVLPNGIDASLFQPRRPDRQRRACLGLEPGPVLGFLGGLRPWHGLEILPSLLSRLQQRFPSLRLLIVGDGPLREGLERDLAERGLAGSTVFMGSVPHEEVAGLLHQVDVALAPYGQAEHPFYFSPLKLFEYMACGAPVVAAALGQIAEVVRDGETGLLYPPGDLEALAAACDRLLTDPPLAHRLGQAAAREVHARYTWDHNAARVIELARGLMAQKEDLVQKEDP